jgi:ribonuclease P protein component
MVRLWCGRTPVKLSGDQTREADLSTEQAGAQAPSRLPDSHGDRRRPQGSQRPSCARPEAAQRLTSPGTLTVPAVERLRKRVDFVAAAAGSKAPAAAFVLQARQRLDAGAPRVGFTVSKKVGNSVVRNRVRRRLREVVRLCDATRLRTGNDYVVIGRRAALSLPFEKLVAEFSGALTRIHKARAAYRPDRPRGTTPQTPTDGNQGAS